jgi:hypothetical protein
LRSRAAADTSHPHARAAYVWYFGALTLTFTLALIYYLNFRYGWSQARELGMTVEREPRDRDYFFMWTFSLWGVLAGIGLAWLTRALRPRVAVLALTAAVLVPLGANWRAASRTDQSFTNEWAKDLLMSLEPNAIIVASVDNDSFPLWHAQAVEGIRRDVTVALTPYLGMEWYARQLNQRSPIWNLSDRELDSIPPYYVSRPDERYTHGAIDLALGARAITRDQLLVLYAIKDSFPSRPVYFSIGAYHSDLGLGPYVKRVGLVHRLMPTPVLEGDGVVRVGNAWVDVPRSLELWDRYTGARQAVREGRWVDGSSSSIPLYYAGIGQELAFALQAQGRTAEAIEVMELAQQVANAVQ